MAGQQVTTPTFPKQRPDIQTKIPPPQMNTSRIPVYHLDVSVIQALLSQATATAGGGGGGTQGNAQ